MNEKAGAATLRPFRVLGIRQQKGITQSRRDAENRKTAVSHGVHGGCTEGTEERKNTGAAIIPELLVNYQNQISELQKSSEATENSSVTSVHPP
ncbi:hypothetical protein [Longimicrobium terrae]|uniref:hypothetical protein n=1 Tax=Longimicrobium terrae TaxID=1639882 RepID=UPI00197BE91A|nr:hypothetical protein [Longimicrobium terrae]